MILANYLLFGHSSPTAVDDVEFNNFLLEIFQHLDKSPSLKTTCLSDDAVDEKVFCV
jgi:hypothetical protein